MADDGDEEEEEERFDWWVGEWVVSELNESKKKEKSEK